MRMPQVDAANARARELGRSLLLLDTETGSDADLMYEKWSWRLDTVG